MRLSEYDYHLPPERIAQQPVEPRDHARLLQVERQTGARHHHHFWELPTLLEPGDLLVVNETRVTALRLFGQRPSGGAVEVLLLRPALERGEHVFEALVRPGRKLPPGSTIVFPEVGLTADVLDKTEAGGRFLAFSGDDVHAALERAGQVPLPPYITAPLENRERYQTVYARQPGSAAAPTAGLHFTPELFARLAERGVGLTRLQLDVGLGTFRPIQVENVDEHTMHAERFRVPAEAADAVNSCKGRVIAVGTTSVRALESAAQAAPLGQRVVATEGETQIFIRPGHPFRAVDGLITNFHQPHSTLLLLVAALIGRDALRASYAEALANEYRFLSFGDAMLLL